MTRQEFEQFNQELQTSGMTQIAFMASKGLPIHRYYYWKKKYSNHSGPEDTKSFIQIGSSNLANSSIRMEYPNGVVINFQSYPGSKALLKLIKSKH